MENTLRQLEELGIEIENIRQLVLLCRDGFYKRNVVELDTAEGIMDCLTVLVERLSSKVDIMVYELERKELL